MNKVLTDDEKVNAARREYQREYRKKNKKRIREYHAQWRAENREKITEANRRHWVKKFDEQNEVKS